jgi:ATP-binding cassette subfamily B protein
MLLVQGVLPLLSLYLLKLIFDAVGTAVAAPSQGGGFRRVVILIALAAGVAVVSAVVRAVGVLVRELQALHLTDAVHEVLHAKSVEADLEYYESPEYHDTLHRAQQEALVRPTRIVAEVAQVGQNGVSLLAIMGLLVSLHWVFAAVLLAAVVPGLFVKVRFSRNLYRWAQRRTPIFRRTHYLNSLLTGGAFAKEVRLFGLGPTLTQRFRDIRRVVRTEKMRLFTRRSVFELIAQVGSVLAVFASLVFIAQRAVAGVITIGDMVMYFGAFQRGQEFFREMLAGLAGLYEDNLFLHDLDAFMNLKPRVIEAPAPRPFPRSLSHGITVEGVTFHYPGLDLNVLEDISFHIHPGEHVAVVGENGSGKTTLVKLLCRLYDPDTGTIRIDETDLREFRVGDIRRQMGVIFQDFVRYHMSARDNVWFGDVTVDPESERIVTAAARTGADRVIRALPDGYSTVLGREFEDGSELSLGEWQKVALARAFLRETQIIVLDEPTASLDPRSEAEVFARFHELARGRTAILISHRLSTVRMADRILVLANGRIVEAGGHDELIRAGGQYAELFEIQASKYR